MLTIVRTAVCPDNWQSTDARAQVLRELSIERGLMPTTSRRHVDSAVDRSSKE